MNHEKLAELIKRYKSGTATPEEIAMLDKIWSHAEECTSLTDQHTEEQLMSIEREMFSAIKSEIHKQETYSRKSILVRPLFYKVAATVLLLMTISLWWYSSSIQLQETRTAFGEQRTVVLPDQSNVVRLKLGRKLFQGSVVRRGRIFLCNTYEESSEVCCARS